MSPKRLNSRAVAADMGGGDSLPRLGDPLKKGAHGGNLVSPVPTTPSLLPPDVESMGAEDVLRWAYAEFGDKLCLTCSWQKQSSVLVHMVSELGLDLPVIELADVIFEAPTKSSQVWFIKQFGPEVNLGNIPPDEVIPLETLRLGLRGDTLKEVGLRDERSIPS